MNVVGAKKKIVNFGRKHIRAHRWTTAVQRGRSAVHTVLGRHVEQDGHHRILIGYLDVTRLHEGILDVQQPRAQGSTSSR